VTPVLADCHLHFEGSLPVETLVSLASRAGHAFRDSAVFERARSGVRDARAFLDLYAELCGLFRAPEDFSRAAGDIARSLAASGVSYAEIYFSPEICRRLRLSPEECLDAVCGAFEAVPQDAARCRVLLDAVRQWGADSAHRVLDLFERRRPRAVVGFGIGGEEGALPASDFADVFARARTLGLFTSVHAGEWGGPESIRDALDELRPDRLDHGIAAVRDAALLRRLVEEGTILLVAPSSNRSTGAVASLTEHPLPALLEAGVRVALGADDPLLFATSTRDEYRLAVEELGLSEERVREMAGNAWRAAFCTEAERRNGLAGLAALEL
jgi:adenosine deaminase